MAPRLAQSVGQTASDRRRTGEPGHLPVVVRAAVTGEDPDRHQAVNARVVCAPDLTEPARTDRLDQPVAAVQHGP